MKKRQKLTDTEKNTHDRQIKRHMTDRERCPWKTGKETVIYRERDSDIKRERQRPLERLERV